MLAFQVEFLTDLDTLPGQSLLDWLPQRSQLLCALADAAQRHRLGSSAQAALYWLEAQLPPATHAVPSPPHSQPHRLTVTYAWPHAQPDATTRRLLAHIAQCVATLGGDRTPVRVRLCDASDDRPRCRTPRRSHPTTSPARRGPFGDMIVFQLDDAVRLDVLDTLDLAVRLRAAVLKRCGHPHHPVPEILSGHDVHNRPSKRDHAAYVALPCVGQHPSHHDGRLAGLAIVLPADVTERDRRHAWDVAADLDRLWLRQDLPLRLQLLDPTARVDPVLQPETWAVAARSWTSATPVVLDRFPRRDGRDLEDIVRRSCRNLGLPDDVEVVADRVSRLHGVPDSEAFPIRRRDRWQHHTPPERDLAGPPRPSRHVTLVFREKVRGPLLLGHSRHFGLGLLQPLPAS